MVGAGGCSGGPGPGAEGPRDVGPIADGGPSPSLSACDPPLELVPGRLEAVPGQIRAVTATGGTGRPLFALDSAPSGGRINPRTGAYVAGPTVGVTDRVRVTDEGCLGEAEAEIAVRSPFVVSPPAVELRPGETFSFATAGGSGQATFRWVRGSSGGSVDSGGRYAAGPGTGLDVIEARDEGLGATAQATVTVTESPRFAVEPAWVGLAAGSSFELRVEGGSGRLELAEPGPVSLIDGTRLTSSTPGSHVVELRDVFLDRSTTLRVTVAAPLEYDAVAAGSDQRASQLDATRDLDGDGWNDLVLGHPEADVTGHDSGAVFVFAGGPEGFAPAPRWTGPGFGRGDGFGRGLALADVDGDGAVDLVVGAPFEDRSGRSDAGAVRLLRGAEGAFGDVVWEVVGRESERLGEAIAVCDFNGDGRLDVAIGRPRATDRRRIDPPFGQGALSIYLGRADGLPGEPDQERWGDVPTEGSWVGQALMEFGESLAAGDVDGDGACDLAAGAPDFDRSGSSSDGLVALFRGVPRAGNDLGGLTPRPVRVWAELDPEDSGSAFGASVALADLSGDGLADLVVGQPGRDLGPSDRQGAVRVFTDLAELSEDGRLHPASEARVTRTFDRGFSDFGDRVAVARVDGDARADLVVGVPRGEAAGVPNDAGGVSIFAGNPIGIIDETPTWTSWGEAGGDRVGAAVTVGDDLDGDGLRDVIAHAATRSGDGVDVGALVAFRSGGEEPVVWTWPTEPSGMEFGAGAAVIEDLTDNGFVDVVVGAPRRADATRGRDTGRFWIYEGGPEGTPSAPTSSHRGFDLHSGFDRLGQSVTSAGDFDGDGRPDLAVTSRFEDQPPPGTFDSSFVVDEDCTETRSNSGAVFVFRGRAGGRLPLTSPDYVLFGPEAGRGIDGVAGDVDVNGDGLDDLVIAATGWSEAGDRAGGAAIYLGRERAIGLTRVSCQPDHVAFGVSAFSDFGAAVAGLGDLDGDGCDEVAIGSPRADPGVRDAGTVSVRWGSGGAGCPASSRWTVLAGSSAFGNAGTSVAGGVDFDDDGTPDLVLGAPRAENPERVGSVAWVSGAALAALPRSSQTDGAPISIDALEDVARAFSEVVDGRFGEALAVGNAPRPWIAVGAPQGDGGGRALTGGVDLFHLEQGSLRRVGRLAGGARAEARWGEILAGAGSVLLVGSRFDSAVFLDGGAVYRFGVEDLPGP